MDELSKITRSLYEDKVKGIISEPDFVQMSRDYKLDKRRGEDRIRIITAQLEQMEAVDTAAEQWVKLVAEYLAFGQIDREMIQELVEKVEVSYAQDSCNYSKCSYNIDITYRIIGPAETLNASAEGFPEDKETAQHAG
jgi:ethanolamine utilization protein EutQ (cupin superfamily)